MIGFNQSGPHVSKTIGSHQSGHMYLRQLGLTSQYTCI